MKRRRELIQLHADALDERAPDISLPLELRRQVARIGDHELDPDLLELLARYGRGQAFCSASLRRLTIGSGVPSGANKACQL